MRPRIGTTPAIRLGMTNPLFATIAGNQLSAVTGGAESRSKLLLDKLNADYGSQGVVSFIGKPTFKSTGAGVSSASGKFDVNALWGGDTQRSFKASVDTRNQSVSGLHTKILGSE
jgi:hypothetical protein